MPDNGPYMGGMTLVYYKGDIMLIVLCEWEEVHLWTTEFSCQGMRCKSNQNSRAAYLC